MKVALICDTHWGVRGDNIAFLDYFKKSVDDFFLPELRKRGIEKIIHLGDLVDRRKYINFMTLNRLRKDFLEPINAEFQMDVIPGNHDTFYKNTNSLNALNELLSVQYNNISAFLKPDTVWVDGIPILYLPWICDDNKEATYEAIRTTEAQICFGHLELSGFQMYKGILNDHGMDSNIFSRFDVVCSGHYHHKSSTSNIHYLGAFCEHIWSDFNDPRGFHIFDTHTRELEFVRNPYEMFRKVWYNDVGVKGATIEPPDDLTNKVVKVIVSGKDNPYTFDRFIEDIEKQTPIEVQVVDDHKHLNDQSDNDIVSETEDTLTVFKQYINSIGDVDCKKETLEKVIVNLYMEATQIQ